MSPSQIFAKSMEFKTEEHLLWLASNGAEGKRFELKNCTPNLSQYCSYSFNNKDLSKSLFSKCCLNFWSFSETSLEGAFFSDTTFFSTNFCGADLRGTTFKECLLETCFMDDNTKVDISHIDLFADCRYRTAGRGQDIVFSKTDRYKEMLKKKNIIDLMNNNFNPKA